MQANNGLRGASYRLDDLLGLRFSARQLKLGAFSRARSSLVGSHHSRFRGRGMSFAESRPYQPGDDVRQIDWRVTARSGRTHTKVFEEEKERPVFLIADFGPHMKFGSRVAFKHVVAAEVAALVAWSALSGGDRVGALLAAADGHLELKPASGRRNLMHLLRGLVSLGEPHSAEGDGALGDVLLRAVHVVHPGSLVFVISDFHRMDEQYQRHLRQLRQHNDVVLLQVLDPLERVLPPPGNYPVKRDDRVRVWNLRAGRTRRELGKMLEERRQHLVDFASQHGIPQACLSAGDDVVGKLRQLI